MIRAEAARLDGMERQAPHDAIQPFNASTCVSALSHRVPDDDVAVLDAVCRAWNRFLDEAGHLTSLTAYPYLTASAIPWAGMGHRAPIPHDP